MRVLVRKTIEVKSLSYFCEKCKKLHTDSDICPELLKQMKKKPELIAEAADFLSVAGQYQLISTQALDTVFANVNKVVGTDLTYEGTRQTIRDIQVFHKLDAEAYVNKGYFSSAEKARSYLENATDNQITSLRARLSGTGQEVDWLRQKHGQITSIWEQSNLFDGNAVGVDGETINRFTGETIARTTIKAAQTKGGLGTNVSDVIEALHKGTLQTKDILVGVDGTNNALQKALV